MGFLHTYRPLKWLAQFHDAFNVKRYTDVYAEEQFSLRLLRANLILEEAREVIEELGFVVTEDPEVGIRLVPHAEFSINGVDLEKLAKELADLKYVTYGTDEVFGIPAEAVFEEVHRSNMSKLGDDGKPIYREDGKVLKSPSYRPADVHGVLTGEWL
jgi:predicted HAD superfamily Cof-like phosphohydrolase